MNERVIHATRKLPAKRDPHLMPLGETFHNRGESHDSIASAMTISGSIAMRTARASRDFSPFT